MTAFPMRFSAPLLEVKSRLDAGDFGQVYAFNATNQGELPTKHRLWFADPELAGGGAIMDHTVHLVDIMRWYLGSEVSQVYAQSNKIFHAQEVEADVADARQPLNADLREWIGSAIGLAGKGEKWTIHDAQRGLARIVTADSGAHGLDISVAVTERSDEAYLARQVEEWKV